MVFQLSAVAVAVWFALCHWLFKRLERLHPEKYEEMGRPHLILNNTPRTMWQFIRFLFTRGRHNLQDRAISGVVTLMHVILLLYTVGLAGYVGVMMQGFGT